MLGQDAKDSGHVSFDTLESLGSRALRLRETSVGLRQATDKGCLILNEYRDRLFKPVAAIGCCAFFNQCDLQVITAQAKGRITFNRVTGRR